MSAIRQRLLACFFVCLFVCLCVEVLPATALADRFVIIDSQGNRREIVGRLHGSGQGAYAIELPNGKIEVVAQAAVLERDNTVDWQAVTPQEMAAELTEEFGADTFRHHIEGNVVIGMVLMAPVPKPAELKITGFLRKAARFMNNVQTVFLKFAKDLRLDVRDPETPLVLLIFESDDDFNRYTNALTKGQGLSAGNISGFYHGLTNFLAIRMAECTTFEVPLHEAIHQQVYNRGLLKRLAPIPSWFNEGIASGFEANGDRINAGPTRIHPRYAEQYADAKQVTWDDLILEDLAFQGDVLAGDAYCHAWALHWLLVTKHEKAYASYVKMLGNKQPLVKQDLAERRQDFEDHFGGDLTALKAEFQLALQRGLKTQKLNTRETKRPGYLRTQSSLGDVELTAIHRLNRGGNLEVEGRLKNINPFRNLTYSVLVKTDGGSYAHWVLPDIASNRTVPLPLQYANKTADGATVQASQTFRVHIFSTLPESPEAQRWQRGEIPLPDRASAHK